MPVDNWALNGLPIGGRKRMARQDIPNTVVMLSGSVVDVVIVDKRSIVKTVTNHGKCATIVNLM